MQRRSGVGIDVFRPTVWVGELGLAVGQEHGYGFRAGGPGKRIECAATLIPAGTTRLPSQGRWKELACSVMYENSSLLDVRNVEVREELWFNPLAYHFDRHTFGPFADKSTPQ